MAESAGVCLAVTVMVAAALVVTAGAVVMVGKRGAEQDTALVVTVGRVVARAGWRWREGRS